MNESKFLFLNLHDQEGVHYELQRYSADTTKAERESRVTSAFRPRLAPPYFESPRWKSTSLKSNHGFELPEAFHFTFIKISCFNDARILARRLPDESIR